MATTEVRQFTDLVSASGAQRRETDQIAVFRGNTAVRMTLARAAPPPDLPAGSAPANWSDLTLDSELPAGTQIDNWNDVLLSTQNWSQYLTGKTQIHLTPGMTVLDPNNSSQIWMYVGPVQNYTVPNPINTANFPSGVGNSDLYWQRLNVHLLGAHKANFEWYAGMNTYRIEERTDYSVVHKKDDSSALSNTIYMFIFDLTSSDTLYPTTADGIDTSEGATMFAISISSHATFEKDNLLNRINQFSTSYPKKWIYTRTDGGTGFSYS